MTHTSQYVRAASAIATKHMYQPCKQTHGVGITTFQHTEVCKSHKGICRPDHIHCMKNFNIQQTSLCSIRKTK